MIYTEEMKQVIESHGMMVIEFKKKVIDGIIIITEVANKIVAIIRECMNKWFDFGIRLFEKTKDFIKQFQEIIDFKPPLWLIDCEKFQFVRKIDNGYRLMIRRMVLIHCRNNC